MHAKSQLLVVNHILMILLAFFMGYDNFAKNRTIEKMGKTKVDHENKKSYDKADKGKWKEVFSDEYTKDWKQKWFLDGEIGTVKTGKNGMTLTGGPEYKNDAHHMVLWTKESFKGDLKIEYDYNPP